MSKKITRFVANKAWFDAQMELDSARSLFNNAPTKWHTDVAIELENNALKKLEQLKKLHEYNSYATPIYSEEEAKKTRLKRAYEWFIKPYKEIIDNVRNEKDIERIDIDKITWEEIAQNNREAVWGCAYEKK